MVWPGGKEDTTHAGERQAQPPAIFERQMRRAQASSLRQSRELCAVTSGQHRTMSSTQSFVEDQTSGAAVRTVSIQFDGVRNSVRV